MLRGHLFALDISSARGEDPLLFCANGYPFSDLVSTCLERTNSQQWVSQFVFDIPPLHKINYFHAMHRYDSAVKVNIRTHLHYFEATLISIARRAH
jgi:hypothetical protein